MLPPISRQWLERTHGESTVPTGPITVLQFGEGNFLRAFVDWMLMILNTSGKFSGAVRLVQPIPRGMVENLARQQYVYSLFLRGVDKGQVKDESFIIDVIRDSVNPYTEWDRFLAGPAEPDIRFVVSNTTEAGIVYRKCDRPNSACPETFPAKVAAMLAARYDGTAGRMDKGLVFLPCELIEKNGEKLREAVLRHLADWGLSGTVGKWVEGTCQFCNTLVDRIVTGYPAAEAEDLWKKIGCQDEMLVVGEYFHLWVIEGDAKLREELPFAACGLNVIVTDDLTPYRDRKVRVLNGAHTGNVLAAYLAGVDTVADMMGDTELRAFLESMVLEEILPGVRLPEEEKRGYATSVFERFQNPFVRHELLSISLNSVSKWKVRVLPSLKDYVAAKGGKVPARLAFSLAALITFYHGEWVGDTFTGTRENGTYPIRDDRPVLDAMHRAWNEHGRDSHALAARVLSDTSLWDEDLTAIPGVTDAVASGLAAISGKGIRAALTCL